MKFIVNTPYFLVDKRGNHKLVPAGKVISQQQFDQLNSTKQAKCSPVVNTGRHLYTKTELIELVQLYLINQDTKAIVSCFRELNPNQPHSVDSLNQLVRQLRSLDNRFPTDTEWTTKQLVMEVAQVIAPEVFC